MMTEAAPMIDTQTKADENVPQLVGANGAPIERVERPEKDWTKVKFPVEMFENRVVIRRDDAEEVTSGGIVLPERAQQRVATGTVIATGPGMMKGDKTYIPMQGNPPLAIGDRVVFEKFRHAIEVEVEGRTYHVYRDNDFIGRVPTGVKVRHNKDKSA